MVLDVVPAARVTSPYIAIDLLRADGQRCASMLTTRGTPSGPIVDSLLANVRAVYTIDLFSFDKPTGSQTPTCLPPFTTTKMRVHLHEASPTNPAVLDKTFDIVFNWTS